MKPLIQGHVWISSSNELELYKGKTFLLWRVSVYVCDAQKDLETRCLNDWKAHRKGSCCSTPSDLYSLLVQTLMWMHLHRPERLPSV